MSRIRASKTPSAYKDLGFKNPEKWEAKANLAIRINNLIESRSLTQSKAPKDSWDHPATDFGSETRSIG